MNKIGWRLVKMLRGVIASPFRTRDVNDMLVKVQNRLVRDPEENSSINGTAKPISLSPIS